MKEKAVTLTIFRIIIPFALYGEYAPRAWCPQIRNAINLIIAKQRGCRGRRNMKTRYCPLFSIVTCEQINTAFFHTTNQALHADLVRALTARTVSASTTPSLHAGVRRFVLVWGRRERRRVHAAHVRQRHFLQQVGHCVAADRPQLQVSARRHRYRLAGERDSPA